MPRIALVDDDRVNTQLIQILLEEDGFDVVICPDLARIEEAAQEGLDLLMIDVHLARGEDGLALLQAIRAGQTAAPADIPVVITSGDDRRQEEARLAGASDFWLKPYSPSRLSDKLADLISQRPDVQAPTPISPS